jgi:hypothetical protein
MGTRSAAGLSSRSGLYAHRARALSALESSRFAETAKDSQRNDPALWWGRSHSAGKLCAYGAAVCDRMLGAGRRLMANRHFARSDGGRDRSRGIERVSSAKPKKMPAGQRSGEDPLTFT